MFEKQLPGRPNLEQYKKQAKELLHAHRAAEPEALERIRHRHPTLHKLSLAEIPSANFTLADAQYILAREHSFDSWPKFAAFIETQRLIRTLADLPDPVSTFIEAACVSRHSGHSTGTLEQAQLILQRDPEVATANIYTAAILADEPTAKKLLTQNPRLATATGGPHNWDALTHLCFSRYLRLDPARSEAFVNTARTLLDAGANAQTGWYEMIDHPNPRPIIESTLYGAAGIAKHPELTRLLLERGADPNDEETPYHLPETHNNEVMKIVVESGKLNEDSLTTLLLRKADWHDLEGIRYLLAHGANPNHTGHWKNSAFQHSLLRDNSLEIIRLFLDHGADPTLENREGRSAIHMATRRGRGDVLDLFVQRGFTRSLVEPIFYVEDTDDPFIAACARNDQAALQNMTIKNVHLFPEAGTVLAQFAGNGNTEGVRNLLDLGIDPASLNQTGDLYFDITENSTALHAAAWRAHPETVKLLIARGTPINALDAKGRTALQLAIKAAVDSFWTYRRTTESIQALLEAGATNNNIELPTGYDEADTLFRQYSTDTKP